MRKLGRLMLVTAVLFSVLPGVAEERYKKWTFEFSIGGDDPSDEIRSDAGNLSVFTDDDGQIKVRADPRPDRLDSHVAQIDSTNRIDFRLGYGVAEWGWGELILDAGVGWTDTTITGLEVAFLNCGETPDPNCLVRPRFKNGKLKIIPMEYHTLGADVGDLRQVPVSLNGLVRFRPTKRLNPYVGIGGGYLFVEFKESEEFTELADFLDASRGSSQLLNRKTGRFVLGPEQDIARPKVDAPDTAFLEARVGIEWQLSPRWSLFVDTRYEWADNEVNITIDDDQKLGRSTPNGATEVLWPLLGTPFVLTDPGPGGPKSYQKFPGGIGSWFVNGGELDYGGFSFGFGARVSF